MKMKLFISYHLADTNSVRKIKDKLRLLNINFYSVSEDADFTNWHNEEISKFILKKMNDCDILVCVIGKETYKRPHVDYELHQALKGDFGKRLGIIALILEGRGDSIYQIDRATFPARLSDNEKYIVLLQNATFFDKIKESIGVSDYNRKNRSVQVNNKRKCMKLPNKYYDES